MELAFLMAKVAFTAVFLPVIFIKACYFFEIEPSSLVKGITVAPIVFGLIIGVISVVLMVWSI
jgi:uncharacterized membrane protein